MNTGKVEFAPDCGSKKKGVMFSNKTGGAYADVREVIEDEVGRIGTTTAARKDEHQRLKDEVVTAATLTCKAERIADDGSNTLIRTNALIDSTRQRRNLRAAVDALINFESRQGME